MLLGILSLVMLNYYRFAESASVNSLVPILTWDKFFKQYEILSTATNWLFSNLMMSPTLAWFIHFSFCSLRTKTKLIFFQE